MARREAATLACPRCSCAAYHAARTDASTTSTAAIAAVAEDVAPEGLAAGEAAGEAAPPVVMIDVVPVASGAQTPGTNDA